MLDSKKEIRFKMQIIPKKPKNRHNKIKKHKWTAKEDEFLLSGIKKFGKKKWTKISKIVKTRTNKQCRERYTNHLDPIYIKKKKWSENEKWLLFMLNKIYNKKWCIISKKMKNRSQNDCKNFWRTKMSKNVKLDLEEKLLVIKNIFLKNKKDFEKNYKKNICYEFLEKYFIKGENEDLIYDNKIRYQYRKEIVKEKLNINFFKKEKNIKRMIRTVNENLFTKEELIFILSFFLENFEKIVEIFGNEEENDFLEKKIDKKILKGNFLYFSNLVDEGIIELRNNCVKVD